MKSFIILLSLIISTIQAEEKWYRGNTHTHTNLCNHADSSPDEVTKIYHDLGYNFLILSEHNVFIDPASVNFPKNARKDFILIPGEEVSPNKVHTTAMNVKKLVNWRYHNKDTSKVIQKLVDFTEKQGGVTILNHPAMKKTYSPEDVYPVDRLYMFEVFTIKWKTDRTDKDPKFPNEEVWWDRMLSNGMVMYAVACDDAHNFKRKHKAAGRGWVMVKSKKLDPDSITASMYNGNFYASNGVFLKKYQYKNNKFYVEADRKLTNLELKKNGTSQGIPMKKAKLGYRIELIGQDGKIYKTVHGSSAVFTNTKDSPYFRVRVSKTIKDPKYGIIEFCAWAQPIFNDERLKQVEYPHDYLKHNHPHHHPHSHSHNY